MAKPYQSPLVCHGHSRPIVELAYSAASEDGVFLISASKDGKPMLRNGEMTKFIIALSELADVDFNTARRILDKKEIDALAIVCKAADFDRSLFLTFAVLVSRKPHLFRFFDFFL